MDQALERKRTPTHRAERGPTRWPLVTLPLLAFGVAVALAQRPAPWPMTAVAAVLGLHAFWLVVVWPLAEHGRDRVPGLFAATSRGVVAAVGPAAALAVAHTVGVASYRGLAAACGVQLTLALFVAHALALSGRARQVARRLLPLIAVLPFGVGAARRAALAEPLGPAAGPLAWAALALERAAPAPAHRQQESVPPRRETEAAIVVLRPWADRGRAGFPVLVQPVRSPQTASPRQLQSASPVRWLAVDFLSAPFAATVVPEPGDPGSLGPVSRETVPWRAVPPGQTLHLLVGAGAAPTEPPRAGGAVVAHAPRLPGPLAVLRAFDTIETAAEVGWLETERMEVEAFRAWRAARRRLPDPSVDPRAYDELLGAEAQPTLPAWLLSLAAALALVTAGAGLAVGRAPGLAAALAVSGAVACVMLVPASRATVREDVVLALRAGSRIGAEERWLDVSAQAAGVVRLAVPTAPAPSRGAGVLEAVRAARPEPLRYAIVSGPRRAWTEGLRLPAGGHRLFRVVRRVRLRGGIDVLRVGGREELLNQTGMAFQAAYLLRGGRVYTLGALPDGGSVALKTGPDSAPPSAFLVRARPEHAGLLRLALRVRRRNVPLVLLLGETPPRAVATGGFPAPGHRVALLSLE